MADPSLDGLLQKLDNQSLQVIKAMITIEELNKLYKQKKLMTYWQRILGFSEDSLDIAIGSLEKRYRKTKNPKYVWRAIRHINKREMLYYPKWIRNYLEKCAKQIDKCEPGAGAQSDVVAALGFSTLRQLRKEDNRKIDNAFNDMCYLISRGKTIEDAALEVTYMVNDDGLEPKQRGYLGNSKLEKIYRDLIKKTDPNEIKDYVERRENREREYKKAQRKGYGKDLETYVEELVDDKLDKKYDNWLLSDPLLQEDF